jgi:ribosomal protein S18 acetylase RimI-like enzyme
MSDIHHRPGLLGAARRAFPSFEEAVVAGWYVRSDPELPNRRANCAWAVGEPAVPLAEATDEVVAWFRDRNRRPIVLTEPGSPVDIALADWEVQAATDVMTAPVGSDGDASATEPVETWSLAWARIRDVSDAHRAALVERLADVDAVGAVQRAGTNPVAGGLGVAEGPMVGVFNVATDPRHRRKGHATRITEALMAWGAARGASTAYLQVEASNPGAAALYRGLGFTTACRYHYRLG